MAFALVVSVSAQRSQRLQVPASLRNIAVQKQAAIDETTNLQNTVNPYVSRAASPTEFEIGGTVYDLQSNGSSPSNRIEAYQDGTIGATWTRGTDAPSYNTRGTAYNYFDGANWGPAPTTRVESVKSGWPAYTSCGPTGEAFVSHISGTTPLNFFKREVKGTGAWVGSTIPAPTGATGLLWPRMVSSGANHEILHVIALTAPVANGGAIYNGQDGALVYSRSTDAGATWSTPVVLPEMTSDYYVAFGGDSYQINSVGSNIVILITDNWTDLFAMVSHDDGETWERKVIWEHPIPLWNNTPSIDTIYCPDGAGSATFGPDGKLHVAFGVNRGLFEQGDTAPSWFPWVDGLAYWNEDMPTWTGLSFDEAADVLDPNLLYESGNLIAFMADLNQNGQLDFVGFEIANLGLYYISPTSMPQIVVDQNNSVYVVYSSVTETYDNGAQQYRHLWMTYAVNGGSEWRDLYHLSDDIIHMLDECVFPSIATERFGYDENLHVVYQADVEPGLSVRGDEDAPGENIIYYAEILKPDVGINSPAIVKEIEVSAAYPNPFTGITSVDVTLVERANVSVEIYSVTGQKVKEQSFGQYPAGMFKLDVNASDLNTGIYLLKVKAGDKATTTRINVL